MYTTISFYQYTEIEDPKQLHEELRNLCSSLNVLGRILIGAEGINGAVSGRNEDVKEFKLELGEKFQGLTFREQNVEKNSYHKLVVRVRNEICVFGEKVDLKNKGEYVEAKELEQWYENNEDFIIVDARNDYEYDVGRFKGAVKLPIKNFREFKDVAPKELEKVKDKKIVLYCTGGIRCEKASAYMKEQGFKNVYHIKGGIINYVNEFEKNWEGGLFVFDDRLVSEHGEAVTTCIGCGGKTSKMINCHNVDCDALIVICCGKHCSAECMDSSRQRKERVVEEVIGKVENWYRKNGVALVKVEKPVPEGITITIKGKTTNFQQEIKDIETHEDNLITFPVREKVRENDHVVISQTI